MVEDLPDIRRRLHTHRAFETRHLPNGIRVGGTNAAAIGVVADFLAATPDIRYASRYTYAVADLTVDTLESFTGPPISEEAAARLTLSLADNMSRLDVELARARTGRLIRIFLVAGRGSAHCTEVSAGRHLAAVALFDGDEQGRLPLDRARRADSAAAALTNELRQVLHQRPFDYGGWLAQAEMDPAGTEVNCEFDGRTIEPHVTAADPAVARACLQHIDCRKLHYAAVYRRGEVVAAADVMHHPELDEYLYGQAVEQRRRIYADLGARINSYSNDLTMTAGNVIGYPIRHLVLDVERGAIYFHWLDHSTYIMGVTLDQDQVATSELEIAGLAANLTSA
jgi:hypothetical protein